MLHHVALEVVPANADRFAELLGLIGLAEIPAPETLGAGYRWFEREGTQVHLILTERPSAPGLGHSAFVAPDYELVRRRLTEAGFELTERRRHWGAERCSVIAPGGHRIEIVAAPPPPTVAEAG